MRRLMIFSGMIFFAVTALFLISYVKPENALAENQLAEYRSIFSVKQGTTTDPSIALKEIAAIHLFVQKKKTANHNRTFRAFIIKDHNNVSRVAIESAKPNAFYQLSGDYAVSPETASLEWKGSSRLLFEGVNAGGIPNRFILDLNDLSLSEMPISQLTSKSPLPSADPD